MNVKLQSEYVVNLERIATPREQCLLFRLGTIDRSVLSEAEKFRFDHAPVLNEVDELLGVVAVAHVRKLYDDGKTLVLADPEIRLNQIDDLVPALTLLQQMQQDRAVVIRDTNGEHESDWFALVTISDLNRHPFRSHLYPIVAELESALAQLIDQTYSDPWDWITWTGEAAQIGHIGRWELEKRNGVDTSPITGCTLTDLINVIVNSDELRPALGFTSKKQFKDFAGSFINVRNQIMHPVRPLILGSEDVRTLHQRLSNLLDLTSRVNALNDERSRHRKAPLRYMP